VRRTRREALSAFLGSYSTPDAIVEHLRQSNDQWRHWRAEVRERVINARSIQQERFTGRKGLFKNADMLPKDIREFCAIDEQGENLLKMAMTKLGLSARAYDRILKVARTIADLQNETSILPAHISEAIQYRSLDRQFWNV